MPPPIPAALSKEAAFALFWSEEVLVEQGFVLAKSTLCEAYNAWALEVPGRPTLSPKHIGMMAHKLAPHASEGLWTKRVGIFVNGAYKDIRPFVWYGLRMIYPRADDPFELAHAIERATGKVSDTGPILDEDI
jgi:hypothetical protein